MRQAGQRAIRNFVAMGTGLDARMVLPSHDEGPRPEHGQYATLLLVTDQRQGFPAFAYRAGEDADDDMPRGETIALNYRVADFSLQFYRDSDWDLAHSFLDWCESENGLEAAQDLTIPGSEPPTAFPIRIQQPLQLQQVFAIVGSYYESRPFIRVPVLYAETTAAQVTGYITEFAGDLCVDGKPEIEIPGTEG